MRKKIFLYTLSIIFILTCLFLFKVFTEFPSKENNNMNIDISERLILNMWIAKNWLISDDSRKFVYDLQEEKLNLETTWKYIKNPYLREFYAWEINIDNNKKINNWVLYINWKKVFKCNVEFCSFYKSENWKYIIFVDKLLYNQWFIKKELAFNVLRIFNLNTFEYKNISTLNYNWDNFSVNEIVWYIKN